MATFSKLLLAIDLSPLSESLLTRVKQLCGNDVDRMHVVHVLTAGMHNPGMFADIRFDAHAQRKLDHTALNVRSLLHRAGLVVPSDRIHLKHGEPAHEIKQLANDIEADLVVVGSHSKENDWLQLPGTTTNCVMQGISSDVMAIRI